MRFVLAPLVVLIVAALLLAQPSRPTHAATILYQPGEHLIGGPAGTIVNGVQGDMYTLDAQSGAYTAVSANQPLQAGSGYFASFSDLTNVRLGPDLGQPVSVQAPAGRWLLVGNPSGYNNATVQGADAVYGYDPQEGFVEETSIAPGQGALVYSTAGGTIVVRPLPNGIDAQLGAGEDQLIDAALPLSALPANWQTTAINTSYGVNGNEPYNYVVQYRPRQNPKPADPVQTNFVAVTLNECKDAAFAAQLLSGSSTSTARALYGDSATDVRQMSAPGDLGQGAVLFHVTTTNGTTQTGHDVLYFVEGTVFVTLQSNEPAKSDEHAFLIGLARQQDALLLAAFPPS